MSDNHDDMSGFDMDTHTEEPEQVDEIKPLDVSDHSEASFNNDFSKDLLAQTMPSSALTDADDDLLAAVRAAEEAAAIKPNNVSDIDMDEQPESSGSEEDDLMKALREAEAAFSALLVCSEIGVVILEPRREKYQRESDHTADDIERRCPLEGSLRHENEDAAPV